MASQTRIDDSDGRGGFVVVHRGKPATLHEPDSKRLEVVGAHAQDLCGWNRLAFDSRPALNYEVVVSGTDTRARPIQRECESDVRIVKTLSGLNPGSTFWSWSRLLSINPAETSNTKQTVT